MQRDRVRGNIRASDVAKDRELLNRLGYGVLDVQTESGDVGFEDVRRYSYLVAPELSPRATARRLRDILGRPFSEEEARAACSMGTFSPVSRSRFSL